jgi:hypothetical protein
LLADDRERLLVCVSMSHAHRLAPRERASILQAGAGVIAVSLLGTLGACGGSSRRDQWYGTDAGANYQGPPPVVIYNDGGATKAPDGAATRDGGNEDAPGSTSAPDASGASFDGPTD